MSAMKEMIAGAARSLWVDLIGPQEGLQEKLNGAYGGSIIFSEAMRKLGDRFAGLTPAGFEVLSQQRWRAAEAAQYLFMTHGTDSGWLIGSRAGQVIDAFEGVRLALTRDSSVADAAQWLHMNRLHCKPGYLFSLDSESIIRVFKIASDFDALKGARHEDKKYSLSDLQAAYAVGHYDGCNAPNAHINETKRDAALKEI